MTLKLFTKSYHKDQAWLALAFDSIEKYCQDPVDWTIVCDRGELEHFKFTNTHKITSHIYEIQSHWPDAAELGSGYIQQQWVKMTAHRVMGNGYFLNWDSDVVALRNFDCGSFMNEMRNPILWFTPFNDLMQGGDEQIHRMRQNYIKTVFNIPEAPFEWMRCMPLWMNGEILRIGETRREWNDTKLLMKSNHVNGLSEFNLIGQLSNMLFPDAYAYKNTSTSLPTWAGPIDSKTQVVHQCYSWGQDHAGVRRILGL